MPYPGAKARFAEGKQYRIAAESRDDALRMGKRSGGGASRSAIDFMQVGP
jgi:hypothetical protein